MFKNYLKIAYRSMIKNKSYSLINIFGLSLGIACCILIFAYIGYELSYDRYHENADNIYRLVQRRTVEGRTQELASVTGPMGPALIRDFPEVLDAVRLMPTVIRSFFYEDKKFFQSGVFYADQSIFNVFSFELIEGNPETALEAPFTMVLTEATAQKYFGDENPIGKTINWDNKFDYQVTGVVKEPPPNSHFTFTAMASFSTLIRYAPRIGSRWTIWGFDTYVLLRENTYLEEFEQKLVGFNERHLGQVLKEAGGTLETYLQPLTKIHLHSRLNQDLGTNNDIRLIRAFAAIAIIILCIACINFMNLATARSARRAKEVGLRKVLGAERKRLLFQFFSESFIFALFSLIVAMFIVRFVLPYFNSLASRQISINYMTMPWLSLFLAGIVVFVGMFAGSYPAFFLSAIRPVVTLKGNLSKSSGKASVRSILVVSQFVVSIILIVCTIIIFNQQKLMRNKDLGFTKEFLLSIALQNDEVRIGLESFKNELLKIPGIISTCGTSMVPGEMYLFNTGTYPEGASEEQMFRMDNFYVDHDFLRTFEIEVVTGRGFTKEMPTDVTDALMINETAAKRLGWDDPIGKEIKVLLHPFDESTGYVPLRVIGVFRDIHQRSLYSVINPTFVQYIKTEGPIENRARRLSIRLETNDLSGTLATIEQKWKDIYPNYPYHSFFLDEFFDRLHGAEEKLGQIFRAFSVMAIIIGCLGLLGLASFTAEQRTKEIGIRKVLGSTVGSIVILLCRKYVYLVVVANAIAWPIAFFAMKKWLQSFPYAVNIGLMTFVLTALLAFAIAICTVGYQSIRAARKNPIESLRYE
ncbi:ABC transporter permease [Acidobacteriota bacterium]